jgi:hypothetical protein
MIPRRGLSVLCSALALVLFTGATAGAQIVSNFDHLKCYKLKDFAKKASYSVDLLPEQRPPFNFEQGCKLKVPAKLFCIDVDKVNVQPPPPPPGAPPGPKAHDYLCYAVKCPKQVLPQLVVTDQFGRRDVFIKPPKFVCAPAVKDILHPTPSATPPPPPLPTETRTPDPTATRTPGCDFDPTAGGGQCAGPCPPGEQCVFIVLPDGTSDCDCRAPDPACHLPTTGGNVCIGPCPDPRDQCRNGLAGEPPCVCAHPCSPDPPDPALPPTCSGDCPHPTDRCAANAAGGCDCVPAPCGTTTEPTCDGVCPNDGEACVPTGGPGSPCFCETGTPPPCGGLAGSPQCLGGCPANTACFDVGSTCNCQ